MASLQTINTDCQQIIFKLCSLRSQLNLLKTCKQFKACVEDIWRRDWKELQARATPFNDIEILRDTGSLKRGYDGWRIQNATLQDLDSIFAIVNPHIEKLVYFFDSEKMLDLLQKYPFANLRSLEACETFQNDLTDNSQFFYKIMDTITKWKLKELKLNFYDGPKLSEPSANGNYSHFEELEKLVVNENENVLFRSVYNFMPKLKILSLQLNVKKDFKEISKSSWKLSQIPNREIVELRTFLCVGANGYQQYISNIIDHSRELPSIRRITFVSGFWNDIFILTSTLPKLDNFIVLGSEVTVPQILDILFAGQNLDTIEFNNCWTESRPIILDVDSIMGWRKKPITIIPYNYTEYSPLEEGQEPVVIQLSKPTEFIKIVSIPTISIFESMDFYEFILKPK